MRVVAHLRAREILHTRIGQFAGLSQSGARPQNCERNQQSSAFPLGPSQPFSGGRLFMTDLATPLGVKRQEMPPSASAFSNVCGSPPRVLHASMAHCWPLSPVCSEAAHARKELQLKSFATRRHGIEPCRHCSCHSGIFEAYLIGARGRSHIDPRIGACTRPSAR